MTGRIYVVTLAGVGAGSDRPERLIEPTDKFIQLKLRERLVPLCQFQSSSSGQVWNSGTSQTGRISCKAKEHGCGMSSKQSSANDVVRRCRRYASPSWIGIIVAVECLRKRSEGAAGTEMGFDPAKYLASASR